MSSCFRILLQSGHGYSAARLLHQSSPSLRLTPFVETSTPMQHSLKYSVETTRIICPYNLLFNSYLAFKIVDLLLFWPIGNIGYIQWPMSFKGYITIAVHGAESKTEVQDVYAEKHTQFIGILNCNLVPRTVNTIWINQTLLVFTRLHFWHIKNQFSNMHAPSQILYLVIEHRSPKQIIINHSKIEHRCR